jgi:hypothetical protein
MLRTMAGLLGLVERARDNDHVTVYEILNK